MTEPTNHWKLGLFVVVGVVGGILALTFIGTAGLREDGVVYRSYFDEAVTGLESGAAVKFRGVTIGNVSEIGIARDRAHVAVSYELDADTTELLGWTRGSRLRPRFAVPSDLRAQLESVGVSGVKYVQLDHFDPKRFPRPALPFETPPNTIPTAPSTIKSLEDSLVHFVDTMPAVAERSLAVLERLHALLADVQGQEVPAQVATTLARMQETLTVLNAKLEQLPVQRLSAQVDATATELNQTLEQVQRVLARVDGDRGLLASVQRASDSLGEVAGGARGMGDDLGATLRDFRELVQTLQSFVETLERDPDMLIKGRAELPP